MSATTLHRPGTAADVDEREIREAMLDIGDALTPHRDGRRSRLGAMFRAAADVPPDRWPESVKRAVAEVASNPQVPVAIVLLAGAAGASEFRSCRGSNRP